MYLNSNHWSRCSYLFNDKNYVDKANIWKNFLVPYSFKNIKNHLCDIWKVLELEIFRISVSLQLDGCQRITHLLTTSRLALSTLSPIFYLDLVCGRAPNGTIPFKSSFWPKTISRNRNKCVKPWSRISSYFHSSFW